MAPFYAQLDRAFPGSKFILTVREKEAWLRSAEVHWRVLLGWWDRFPRFKRFQEFVSAASTDDIVFYREQHNLSLGDLPQLGAAAQEAYQRYLTEDRLPPHARTDVIWRPIQR